MGFLRKSEYDVEGGSPTGLDRPAEKHPAYVDETGAVPGESFTYGNSTYAKIQRFAGKFGVEQRGIERVPEDERTDKSPHQIGTMVWTHAWSRIGSPEGAGSGGEC